MTRVGFFGAYSIDNTGDVIVGLATRQAVRARVACEEVVLALDLRQPGWSHDWTATRGGGTKIERVRPRDPGSVGAGLDLDALIIGGGGLLIPPADFRRFVDWGDTRAAWNALCSQNTARFDPALNAWYAAIRSACERLAYVSVRNHTTERLLRETGWQGDIAVVPDPAIAYACDAPSSDLQRARPNAPLVGLSVGNALTDPRAESFFTALLAALDSLAARGAIELLVFPFGRIYGDADLATRAAARMPHARLVEPSLTPDETWRLIGQLDLHVCTRLHAMLAAYAQRVPFLVCDEYLADTTATSKIRDFIVDRELERSYLSPWLGTRPDVRVHLALADLDKLRPAAATLAADVTALSAHFDRMVAALNLKPA